MQKHVVSLELSKKLKELGVEQKSHFYHEINNIDGGVETNEIIYSKDKSMVICYGYEYISAFLSSELGEMLPSGLDYIINTSKAVNRWVCICEEITGTLRREKHREWGDTECDSRAKMLIYLLENKIITR